MKLFSFSSISLVGGIAMAGCCCSGPSSRSSQAFAAESKDQTETFERDYLVKGMTCRGCVFGVKKALSRADVSKEQIEEVAYNKPDPEHKIGHAKVKFSKDQYKGQETECKIVKEIKENPGYIAYWDASNPDPCGLKEKN